MTQRRWRSTGNDNWRLARIEREGECVPLTDGMDLTLLTDDFIAISGDNFPLI